MLLRTGQPPTLAIGPRLLLALQLALSGEAALLKTGVEQLPDVFLKLLLLSALAAEFSSMNCETLL